MVKTIDLNKEKCSLNVELIVLFSLKLIKWNWLGLILKALNFASIDCAIAVISNTLGDRPVDSLLIPDRWLDLLSLN